MIFKTNLTDSIIKLKKHGGVSSCPRASTWVLLSDRERRSPFDADHAPHAFFVLTDEAKSLKRHRFLIINAAFVLQILFMTMQELVCRHPASPGTRVLPEVLIVDRDPLGHLHVVLHVPSGAQEGPCDLARWRTG